MRVVITGGTGFVGAHLARELAAGGDEVTCLDVAGSSPLLEGADGVVVRRCDVGWWTELLAAVEDDEPDVIFHTAGILSAAAEERPHAAYRANVTGTHNVLEAARLLGSRVVFTSTIATYGPGVPDVVDESTQQRPTTMYGVSKVFGELLGEYYLHRFGVDFRAIRLPSVIGAGRGPGGASAYSSLIVSEPARGRPFVVPLEERATIPLVYVKDAVAALMAISGVGDGELPRRTYGIAGFSPRAGELAEAVREVVADADITFSPDPTMVEIVDSWPQRMDGSEAGADWGWKESYGPAEAVTDFVAEVRAHPDWP
ncbi:MAG: NAD-dependent epimerase/dehydratase family protein [Actinomycetota bacterium]